MTALLAPWLGLLLTPPTTWAAITAAEHRRARRHQRADIARREIAETLAWLAQVRQIR